MLLFVDLRSVSQTDRRGHPTDPDALAEALGPYLRVVTIVLMGGEGYRLAAPVLLKRFAPETAARVAGTLDDEVPPRPLDRCDRILYWLARRHVLRPPAWLAIQPESEDWAADLALRLVACREPMSSPPTQEVVRDRIKRHYAARFWWGSDPAPDDAALARAHALMIGWRVGRKVWPLLLGGTAREFGSRLDLLLAIHAAIQVGRHHARWPWRYEHWIHLPEQRLGMRRPLEVMAQNGIEGFEEVHRLVWQDLARAL